MSLATRHARHAAALVAREGQPVALPDASTITGVFRRFAPRAVESAPGIVMRLEQQDNPTLTAKSADVATLAAGDSVTCDGDAWTLTRAPEPDGFGLSTLYLMPAADETGAEQFRRWR